MTANNPTPSQGSAPKAGARLRAIGVLVLLVGLGVACLVYWRGTRPEDLSVDVNNPDNSKIVQRNIEMNVGKAGLFMSDLMDDLKDPANQAAGIAVVAILVAAGCFYIARLQARDVD